MDNYKDLIEKLHRENMLWLFVGILVSDNTITNEKQIESSKRIVESMQASIADSEIDIPENDLEQLSKFLEDAEVILENESTRFKTN